MNYYIWMVFKTLLGKIEIGMAFKFKTRGDLNFDI